MSEETYNGKISIYTAAEWHRVPSNTILTGILDDDLPGEKWHGRWYVDQNEVAQYVADLADWTKPHIPSGMSKRKAKESVTALYDFLSRARAVQAAGESTPKK